MSMNYELDEAAAAAASIIDSSNEDLEKILMDRIAQCNSSDFDTQLEGLFCPPVFDGWSCWNATAAGTTALGRCPYFVPGFDPDRFAHKRCMEDGNWFRHPDSNLTWSNYTTCVDIEDLQVRQTVIDLYVTGYSISLVALMVSFAIFCIFRSLKCGRIEIHRNLFASFIVHNSMWLVWYKAVAEKPEVLIDNTLACRLLHVLLHYFLVCNYFWMFCEGLYLHTLLLRAFVVEQILIKWFYLIGWVVPGVLTLAYALVRASITFETNHCWIEESKSTWVLSVPVCLSILGNAVFLVNIVRVLITKLRAPVTAAIVDGSIYGSEQIIATTGQDPRVNLMISNHGINIPANRRSRKSSRSSRITRTVSVRTRSSSSARNLRKTVRATLVLLPLLGLHYVITPFRPEHKAPGEIAYQVVSAIVTSLQGFCVAFLYCFSNGEVIRVLRNTFLRYTVSLKRHNGQPSTRITTEL